MDSKIEWTDATWNPVVGRENLEAIRAEAVGRLRAESAGDGP